MPLSYPKGLHNVFGRAFLGLDSLIHAFALSKLAPNMEQGNTDYRNYCCFADLDACTWGISNYRHRQTTR